MIPESGFAIAFPASGISVIRLVILLKISLSSVRKRSSAKQDSLLAAMVDTLDFDQAVIGQITVSSVGINMNYHQNLRGDLLENEVKDIFFLRPASRSLQASLAPHSILERCSHGISVI